MERNTITPIGNKTILLIDDEQENLKPLKFLMEKMNCRVESADNGAMGIQKARTLKPDFILLDIDMPKINGIKVLRLIRTFIETKDIPVMMMTGNAEQDSVVKTIGLGIKGYISKPYEPVEVMKRITEVLMEGY